MDGRTKPLIVAYPQLKTRGHNIIVANDLLSPSICSHTQAHTRAHTHTHARARTHTHTSFEKSNEQRDGWTRERKKKIGVVEE